MKAKPGWILRRVEIDPLEIAAASLGTSFALKDSHEY